MSSRTERRLSQLEVQGEQLAAIGVEHVCFTLLPDDFSGEEWEALHSVVWRMNADDAPSSTELMELGAYELALWRKACSLVHSGSTSPTATDQDTADVGMVSDEGGRPRFSPSQRRGRSPVLIVTPDQDDQLRAGTLNSPSYVRVLIMDNGRDEHRHLRRELEWLINEQKRAS